MATEDSGIKLKAKIN